MKQPLLRWACALALAAPFVSLSPATAQTAPKVEQYQLANGMTLWVKPDRRAPTAIHMLWVRVGSIDEVDGASGVAHVLEHMMFRGSKDVKPGEFSRRVAALGGRENAFTGRDYTGYYQQIPNTKLEDVMKLESDRFFNNQWADAEFKREIEVVKEERRMRTEEEPRALLHEVLDAATFQASPYRRPIVGWMSDLQAMTADDAREFFKRWYVPANAAVVIVGDVDPAQVKRLADKYYGGGPVRAVPVRKPREEPKQAGIRRVELKAPAEQAYTALAFKVPRFASFDPTPENEDALALTVLSAVLDGYPGARLDRALTQGPDRLADSVGASHGLWGRGPQVFTLEGVPAPGKTAEQVEAALRAQVARVAREGVTEAELNRVKTQWIASEVYKLDSMMNQGRELGNAWIRGLPPDAGERLVARLRGVTAKQVQDVAAKYFGDDQLTVATLRPQPLDPNKAPPRPAPAGHTRGD